MINTPINKVSLTSKKELKHVEMILSKMSCIIMYSSNNILGIITKELSDVPENHKISSISCVQHRPLDRSAWIAIFFLFKEFFAWPFCPLLALWKSSQLMSKFVKFLLSFYAFSGILYICYFL